MTHYVHNLNIEADFLFTKIKMSKKMKSFRAGLTARIDREAGTGLTSSNIFRNPDLKNDFHTFVFFLSDGNKTS